MDSITAVEIVPGMTLPNGATVIAASTREAHEWIILAMIVRSGERVEYATWKCSRPGDGSDTRWGHYHDDDLRAAVADFYERA